MAYAASEVIYGHIFTDKAWYPAQMANSKCRALVAPTGNCSCIIKKNGAQIATIDFTAGNPVPVFANMAAAVTFDPATSDYITVEAPAAPDATLDQILLSLYSERYL
jgi:hypothetical protein